MKSSKAGKNLKSDRAKSPLFQKVLVANRGEIAIRILKTARELGLKTVAIYSEADAKSLHLKYADEAHCVGKPESRDSYLNVGRILEVARKSGADAVHPGYGFLSENADFARQVEKEGLVFIGPDPQTIEKMGDKVIARQTVEAFKVPTAPGTGALKSPEEALQIVTDLLKKRKDFRFPLLIKAAGGGGGKGMRIVRKESELKENLERASSEALKAFNNSTVFVERYIERPRHIEVQVLGDGSDLIHLFERECSLQRRHQKVVEEAQSPSLSPELREKILAAGLQAARSVNYKSAGTVEFIVSEDDEFYFLEMNTRIQVEHPVTEWITSQDLIRAQIEIAQGQRLSLSQENVQPRGHSIELRLYAEDCDHGFLPQPGFLSFLEFPEWTQVRVDTAVKSPCEISSYYDPMIAKISAWAPSRDHCISRLREFLKSMRIQGLVSNKGFLLEILNATFFIKGRYHTQILEDASWRKKVHTPPEVLAAACLKDLFEHRTRTEGASLSAWQEAYALAP